MSRSRSDPTVTNSAQQLVEQSGTHICSAETALALATADLGRSIHLDALPQMAFALALARSSDHLP